MISEVAPKNWSNLGMLLSLSRPQFPVKKRGVPGLVTTAATKDVAALVRCSAQCAHVVTAREIAPAFVFREIVVNDYSQGRRTLPLRPQPAREGLLASRPVHGGLKNVLDSGKAQRSQWGGSVVCETLTVFPWDAWPWFWKAV